MRATSDHRLSPSDLRRSLERLRALPIRPLTARITLDRESDPDSAVAPISDKALDPRTLDPGWLAGGGLAQPLPLLEQAAWWQAPHGWQGELLDRLWRNSIACGFAARRRAKELQAADPDRFLRAGLLKNLGLWTLAAVDLGRVLDWARLPDDPSREAAEREWLGSTLGTLGRNLAIRWKLDRLATEAAWLGDDPTGRLAVLSKEPAELELLRDAFTLVDQTPWSLATGIPTEAGAHSARARILIAEVQARAGEPFVAADASPREEMLTRRQARLILDLRASERERLAQKRLIGAVESGTPGEGLESWADRVGRAFCEDESIATARVVISGNKANSEDGRRPGRVIPLGQVGSEPPIAEVQLWPTDASPDSLYHIRSLETAWDAWAAEVGERDRLAKALDLLTGHVRSQVVHEDRERRQILLAALAEFAAGASHEMNNPLAVIVGRAQLLMARSEDPEVARSLKTILQQAQRISKILRDLMYVARPPEWRDRPCLPDDILRASARELKGDADQRGVRLVVPQANEGERPTRVWTDPDPLRHVADTLIRNALEATPKGGSVVVSGEVDAQRLKWTVHDSGHGLSAQEGRHLFDPFFCGRQAGRGLGLGLPRAARVLAQAGGRIDWHSEPGAGTTFRVTVPVKTATPVPPDQGRGNAGETSGVPEA